MKNLIKILVISKILFLFLVFNSQAASTTGQADVYKVTMKKVESVSYTHLTLPTIYSV